MAVALLSAAVRGGGSWESVAADLARDADIFGDHPYANIFKAMQVGVDAFPPTLAHALYRLAVFPRDLRIPVSAIKHYWAYTRGSLPVESEADLALLGAANLLTLSGEYVEFHDLQHDYLILHAPALAGLHTQLLDAYRSLLGDREPVVATPTSGALSSRPTRDTPSRRWGSTGAGVDDH